MQPREALASSTYRSSLVSAFANGWCNFGVRVAVLPQLAVAIHDDTWVAGVALACAAVGTALTLQFSGRLADQAGRRPMVLAGLVVTALGLGRIGLVTGLAGLLVLSAFPAVASGRAKHPPH